MLGSRISFGRVFPRSPAVTFPGPARHATRETIAVRTRALGKTGLRVSELALGTWGLSGDGYGPVDEAEQDRVLSRAIEMGVSLIDTADAYGGGRMEQRVGRAIAGLGEIVVVTKGGVDRTTSPPRKRFDGAYLRESVERSRRRLSRDRIDVYLLHNPQPGTFAGSEAVDALLELKAAGKIAHWGVSAGNVEVGRTALRKGAEVIELAYNLLQSWDLHRLAGEIMVAGAGVLARSTLGYGVLAADWPKDHDFGDGDHRADRWTKPELARRLEQVAAFRFLVQGEVATMRSAAIRYVLSSSIVTSAVLGPRSVRQIEDVVREIGVGPVYLRDAALARIPRALESVGIEP
jgi:aryl-alcohol dehydrogenase-like predicted oxidoreductase